MHIACVRNRQYRCWRHEEKVLFNIHFSVEDAKYDKIKHKIVFFCLKKLKLNHGIHSILKAFSKYACNVAEKIFSLRSELDYLCLFRAKL